MAPSGTKQVGTNARLRALPSIDRLTKTDAGAALIARYGRPLAVDALRTAAEAARAEIEAGGEATTDPGAVIAMAAKHLELLQQASLRPVLNLTGTVLHTNLGRALLPDKAVAAMVGIAGTASNLEFDLAAGRRGDRDDHLEAQLRRLTGAEAATVVNNNAAAVLLVLNTLSLRKETIVSRGELIEIGGAFRMPDIMGRAGAKLREVGTTNRTHAKDYEAALSPRTGLIMKVHQSNYEIAGFTAEVGEAALADLAHRAGLPLVVDLGSGSIVDLADYGLPHEPTVGETISAGADVVTFSGDKLLGGPQCGLIVGRTDLVKRIKANPLKRALRCDKLTIAALAAVLALHEDPERIAERLPAVRLLRRPKEDIAAMARRVQPAMRTALEGLAEVSVAECESQIGSGARPMDSLPSAGLSIAPPAGTRRRDAARWARRFAVALRALPVPVIGRMEDGKVILDLRCLEKEGQLIEQLSQLPELLAGSG